MHLAKSHFVVEGQKIWPQNLVQIWSNLAKFGSIFFIQKCQINGPICMKNHAWNFFLDWWQFGKIWILLILPKSDQSTHFLKIMIFHAYGSIYLTLLNEKKIDPNLAKIDQILTKFWGQIFCPSTTKWDLARCIELFMSNGSKVIALGALEPPKADFSITLRPLKLQISEKVLRPMKFRLKALVLTYPKPFGMKVGGSQVFSTDYS